MVGKQVYIIAVIFPVLSVKHHLIQMWLLNDNCIWWKWHSGVNAGDVTVAINEGCIRLGVGGKRERRGFPKVLNWVNKDVMMLFTETET